MKTALLGSHALGGAVLERLVADLGPEMVTLITPANEMKVKEKAIALGADVVHWDYQERRGELMGISLPFYLREEGFDVCFAAHWNWYVPEAVREATPAGVLAYHPSYLPWHRGNDAVAKTVDSGKGAGGTVYQMDDGYDTGPIIQRVRVELRSDDNASTLWRRALFPLGVELIAHVAERLQQHGVNATLAVAQPQRESESE